MGRQMSVANKCKLTMGAGTEVLPGRVIQVTDAKQGGIVFRAVALAFMVSLAPGLAHAQGANDVCDWHDLNKVHIRVNEAVSEMARARAANHYDMDGHGLKAEDLLKQANDQLARAEESAKANGNGHCKKTK
jgi:hypothetical protein